MIKRILSLALATLLLAVPQAKAQTQVSPYQPGITPDGITYLLPSTSFRVVVTTTKTHHTPGEFCHYANRFLRLTNVPLTPYDEWAITDIKIYSYGVANKSQAYTIKYKAKTSAPLVTLAPDGRLLAINDPTVNTTPHQLPSATVTPQSTNTTNNGADFKTEEILSAGSTAKMAELTANEIYDIRENRTLLTKGQADFMPKDGEQLKLMLAQLNEQEQGLLQLFCGNQTTEVHTFTYDLTPQGEVNQQLLFNFSRHLGPVDADDPAGIPYYISVRNLNSLPAAAPTTQKAQKEVEDLRYTLPGRAQVSITTPQREWVTQTFPMAQFGRIEHLGGELFNKKFSTRLQLSPITGGIIKIEAEKPE